MTPGIALIIILTVIVGFILACEIKQARDNRAFKKKQEALEAQRLVDEIKEWQLCHKLPKDKR